MLVFSKRNGDLHFLLYDFAVQIIRFKLQN